MEILKGATQIAPFFYAFFYPGGQMARAAKSPIERHGLHEEFAAVHDGGNDGKGDVESELS
jgi:hypothetical protein